MRFLERANVLPLVIAVTCLALSGCGGAKEVRPEGFAFEPRIVGCSGRPPECTSATGWQVRKLAEAHNHLCPEGKPNVLIRADGEFVCLGKLPSGGPTAIEAPVPAAVSQSGAGALAEFKAGEVVAARSGCLACHRIAEAGNSGPGAELTHVGSRLPPRAIERALVGSPEPMPSFSRLPENQRRALVYFLAQLR